MIDFSSVTLMDKWNVLYRQFAYSLDYVAPEVVNREGVNLDSDMWSIGAITYHMYATLVVE